MAYLWMLIGSIFFAAMSLLTESLGAHFSFTWIVAIRSLIAAIWMIGLTLASGHRLVFFKPRSLWMRSLAGCTAMLCLFYALTHYDVAVILSLSGTFPIWVAVLSWPLLGHFPSWSTWLALAISFVGMSLVYLAADEASIMRLAAPHHQPTAAILAAVAAAMFSGVALIGLHKVKEVEPSAVVAHFSGVSTIICLALWAAMPNQQGLAPSDSWTWLRLLGVGLTATVGQFFLTKAFQHGQPARVAVVGLSQVAIAGLYKWIFYQRAPGWLSLLGMALILAATVWVMLRGNSRTVPATDLAESPRL